MNKQLKLAVITVAVILSSILSACGPQDVVLSTSSKIEKQASTWVQQTCDKRADGTCKTMGE